MDPRYFVIVVFLSTMAMSARAQIRSGNGFLFGEPVGSLTLSGGFAGARASSNVFAFTTDQLTLRRSNFSGPIWAADLALRAGSRFDVVLGSSYAATSPSSEFRRLVDQSGLPIQQTTTFRRVPVTVSVKAYLTSRGRSIGQFAWIPARITAYAGAGGGAMWYQFRQSGDFVDFQTNQIFSAVVSSSGWTPSAQTMAGLEYSLSPRFALAAEGKYLWAKANLSGDFAGFNRIDLSGFATTLGLSVRF